MGYIDLMQTTRFELAAEYLLMAAMLAEIKSRMLLPRPLEEEGEEADPRAELVRRLRNTSVIVRRPNPLTGCRASGASCIWW